jgi:hypothetical protein
MYMYRAPLFADLTTPADNPFSMIDETEMDVAQQQQQQQQQQVSGPPVFCDLFCEKV